MVRAFLSIFIFLVACVASTGLSAQTLPFNEAESAKRLEALMQRINQFGATPDGGLNRVAYSDEDRKAREQVIREMARLGLRVRVDAAGNIIGRRNGQSNFKDAIVMGSHIDSVPNGGRFDGVAGVAAALEVIELMNAQDRRTAWPIEVVVFQNEEGGLVGSLGWLGKISEDTLNVQSSSGYTVRDGMKRIGARLDDLSSAKRGPKDVKAFLELHIEQGANLHKEGRDIGIVTGIVGIKWWDVIVEGVANHAGTTPMSERSDAALAASYFIQLVNKAATSFDGAQVATVGQLEAFPGAPNVIPGKVKASLEIRDLSEERIDAVYLAIKDGIAEIEEKTGTTFTFNYVDVASEPALMNSRMMDLIEKKTRFNDLRFRRMPSGAGHDAQDMVGIAPTGMIFVPSIDGISHSPKEATEYVAIARGAKVMLDTVLGIDALQLN